VRILLVSDLHYTLRQFDWVVDTSPAFDLVVLAGDQLDISSSVALDAQIVVVLRYLALLQATGRVAVSSGNHDLTGSDANGERAALWLEQARAAGVPTDGDSLFVGDTLITICPASSIMKPACMKKTRNAADRVHAVFMPLMAPVT
jgi:predicted MPP superfamily phosphohydrolase